MDSLFVVFHVTVGVTQEAVIIMLIIVLRCPPFHLLLTIPSPLCVLLPISLFCALLIIIFLIVVIFNVIEVMKDFAD